MSKYVKGNEYLVVKKHPIILFFRILRLVVVLLLITILYYFCEKYFPKIVNDKSIKYMFFTVFFIIINYEFFKLVLFIVRYYNSLIIITKNHIIVLEILLITKDDLEIIDPYKVTKVDTFSHGVMSNIFGYGTLIIEQQRDSVRKFGFIPNPYKIMEILVHQKEGITEDRRKKYIINEEG